MHKSIYCVGGATIDHKLKSLAPLALSNSNPVTSYTTFGGVARNIAENLSQWTHSVHLQCVVGNDIEGQNLLNHMQTLGVNTEASLICSNEATAHYYAILNDQGNLHLAACDMQIYNAFKKHELISHWQSFRDKSIIFIDANMPKDIIEALRLFSLATDSLLIIDPVTVAKCARIPEDLTGVFMIKPNVYEANALCQMNICSIDDCFLAAKKLLKRGVQYVILSAAELGFVLANQQEIYHMSAKKPAEIIDVNGAGDAFIAGILFGLQQDLAMKDACELGANAASITLTSLQTVVSIPLEKLLHQPLTALHSVEKIYC